IVGAKTANQAGLGEELANTLGAAGFFHAAVIRPSAGRLKLLHSASNSHFDRINAFVVHALACFGASGTLKRGQQTLAKLHNENCLVATSTLTFHVPFQSFLEEV